MMRGRLILLAALAIPLAGDLAGAQQSDGSRAPSAPQAVGARLRRQQLERELRVRLWEIAKQRVGLTDDQMARLEQTSQRFDARRRPLVADERAQRTVLRREILANESADQNAIASALDRLHALQRARLDLQVEEQGELATFMTPIQRAKYLALQEQFRRRAEALRRKRAGSGPAVAP
jgi:hypothetical protein